MSAVSGALELLSSLEPALACAGVRGWGRWEERVSVEGRARRCVCCDD